MTPRSCSWQDLVTMHLSKDLLLAPMRCHIHYPSKNGFILTTV